MTTKVIVNKDKCIGCGACVAIAPQTLDFDEEGISSEDCAMGSNKEYRTF